MPGVELSTSACNGHVVVALRGDMDIIGAADAGAASLVVPGRCLIIDMTALGFIDCGSLGALLRVQWLAWSTGGDVVLAAPQRHVLRLLALTGNDHAFLIHASVQAAVAALPGHGARHGGRPLVVSTAWSGRAAPARTDTQAAAPGGGRALRVVLQDVARAAARASSRVLASGIRQSSPVMRNSWRIFGRPQTAYRLPPQAAARLAVPTSAASPVESIKLT